MTNLALKLLSVTGNGLNGLADAETLVPTLVLSTWINLVNSPLGDLSQVIESKSELKLPTKTDGQLTLMTTPVLSACSPLPKRWIVPPLTFRDT